MISVRSVTKEFFVPKAHSGISGSLRALFSREGRLVRAVGGVSFEIPEGSFVGYVGPNGAGKSTTIKMLVGILRPTSGYLSVAGFCPQAERSRLARHMGVVFGHRTQLWWDLPVRDSFEVFAAMYGVKPYDVTHRLKRFDELLGIGEFTHTPVRKLSLGQRMRADLACALIHRPQVLFLDEPTIGLDVLAKERIRRFLREINQEQNVTIVLTTHDMGDIEKTCERIILIDRGLVVYDGSLSGLRQKHPHQRVLMVEFDTIVRSEDLCISGVEVIRRDNGRVWLSFSPALTPASDLIAWIAARHPIRDLTVQEPELEEVIRQIYIERA